MVEKNIRNKIVNSFTNKDDRILIGNLIDLINEYDINNHIVHTKFLTIYEKSISIPVLNKLGINYRIFDVIEDIERFVIFLIPKYLENENSINIFSKYISVIKIETNIKGKLKHKDYMGAIYSLGLTENVIGNIYAFENKAYCFVFKENLKYILDNLEYVSNIKVKLNILDLHDIEISELKFNYKIYEIKVSSLRVDVIISEVFNLSRNEVRKKIEAGDVQINAKENYYVAQSIDKGDIISCRKCGKFKLNNILGDTKSGKKLISIKKYI